MNKIKNVSFTLSEARIRNAKPNHASECVLGEIGQEKGFERVRAKDGHFVGSLDNERIKYVLPQVARDFIADFDTPRNILPIDMVVAKWAGVKFTLDARQAQSSPIKTSTKRNGKPRKSPTKQRKSRGRCADVRRTHALVPK